MVLPKTGHVYSCESQSTSNVLQADFPDSDIHQTKIADLVQIAPEDFDKKAALAIEDSINAKYANKVIQKIGLCICLYDLLSASDGLIGHGDGLVNVNGTTYLLFSIYYPASSFTTQNLTVTVVEFRLIVFRPFKHEVMVGRISSAIEAGIRSLFLPSLFFFTT